METVDGFGGEIGCGSGVLSRFFFLLSRDGWPNTNISPEVVEDWQ